VEFGLIATPAGLRIYGAGIVSSGSEPRHALYEAAPGLAPQRVAFDLERIMRSAYKIDTFQETYFVIENFGQLFDLTAPDFTPIYAQIAELPTLPPMARVPGEAQYAANSLAG
jgi:phenylalanine-4-hydroxylase